MGQANSQPSASSSESLSPNRPQRLFPASRSQAESNANLRGLGQYSLSPPRPPSPPRSAQPASSNDAPARPQRTSSRIRRARASLSLHLPGVLRVSDIFRTTQAASEQTSAPRTQQTISNDPAILSSNQQNSPSVSELELDQFAYNRYGARQSESRPGVSTETRRTRDYRPMSSLANRISSLTPDRGFRHMIRRRRSPARAVETDDTAMLTRMLSVAAAATAASLVGTDSEDAFQDVASRSGIEGDDGTFARFLHTLRTGRLNALLSQDARAGTAGSSSVESQSLGTPANGLQFFRVFRFGGPGHRSNTNNQENGSGIVGTSSSPTSDAARQEAQDGPNDGRMIPVLMIGIRSLQSEEEQGESTGDGMPSFLDALANFPPADHPQVFNNNTMRPARNGVNFSQRRRASMGGLGLLGSTNRDGRRRLHREGNAARTQSGLDVSNLPSSSVLEGSGSFPPPTTPSSLPTSAMPSESSTPRRRASISSMSPPPSLATHQESYQRPGRTTLESTAEEPPNTRLTRARRLSDSEFTRYGAGSSRRNGVVEPDRTSTSTERENNRSWIIYVLGGNYPENHPILMTPSLFTDSPTYEDMLLLSSLLGPAKPPVASAEEVSAAGGLFQTKVGDRGLQLVGGDPLERVPLPPGEKCLVCLCDFSVREVVRRLHKCRHLFHQECIDQWLTTGRNACPLCRQQGVDESAVGREADEANPSASSLTT